MGMWGNKGKEKKCPDTSGTQTLVTPDQEARVLTIRPPVPIPVVNILCILVSINKQVASFYAESEV